MKTASEGETVRFNCIGISQVSYDVCRHFLLYTHQRQRPLQLLSVSVSFCIFHRFLFFLYFFCEAKDERGTRVEGFEFRYCSCMCRLVLSSSFTL